MYCTPMEAHLWRHTYGGTPMETHLWRHTYGGTPMETHLWRHTYGGTPMEAHLWRHTYGGTPMEAHLWRHTYGGTPTCMEAHETKHELFHGQQSNIAPLCLSKQLTLCRQQHIDQLFPGHISVSCSQKLRFHATRRAYFALHVYLNNWLCP